jgi:hypothetical protein
MAARCPSHSLCWKSAIESHLIPVIGCPPCGEPSKCEAYSLAVSYESVSIGADSSQSLPERPFPVKPAVHWDFVNDMFRPESEVLALLKHGFRLSPELIQDN